MRTFYAERGCVIPIGRVGENEATEIVFNTEHWEDLFGAGDFQLLAMRNKDTAPYPCVITRDENNVRWTVKAADVAQIGYGKVELIYLVNNAIAKSEIYTTATGASLNGSQDTPEPYEDWVTAVLQAAEAAEAAAGNAATSASAAATSVTIAHSAEVSAGNYAASASESANAAAGYASDAEVSKQDAVAAKLAAESSADDAAASQHSAEVSATAARDAKEDAETAKADAETAQDAAETAQASAEAAASRAENAAEELRDTIEEVEQLRVDVDNKTEKYRIDFDGTAFTHDGEQLNYQQLHDIHIESPDFAFIVYGDRAYLLSYVQDDPGAMRELRFESVIATNEVVKTSGIYVISNDGVNIAGITTRAINSENQGNKVNAITSANKKNVTNYPSNKAFTDYLETVTSPIDRSLSALWALTEGTVWRSETDSTEAYSKVIPSGAKGLGVGGWSGKTVAVNQIIRANETSSQSTFYPKVHITNGIATVIGTFDGVKYSIFSSIEAVVGHTYYLHPHFSGYSGSLGTSTVLCAFNENGQYKAYDNANGIIHTPQSTAYLAIRVAAGTYDFTVTPKLVDLTQMGWGDITSVDDERIKWLDAYLAEHPDYDAGSLVSAPVQSVDIGSANRIDAKAVYSGSGFTWDGDVLKASATDAFRKKIYIPADLVGKSLTISADMLSGGTTNMRVSAYIDGTRYDGNVVNNKTDFETSTLTFTPRSTRDYVVLYYGSTSTVNSYKNISLRISGSPNAPYSLNSIPIPAAVKVLPDYGMSAGSAVNKVVARDGKWYYRHEAAQYTFNGTEAWTSVGGTDKWYTSSLLQAAYQVGATVVCDKLDGHTSGNSSAHTSGCLLQSTVDYPRFYVAGFGAQSAAEVQAFTNGMTVVYPLATPVETDITDLMAPLGLNALLCEGGGTVTMVNDAELAVQSDVEYAVKISEVG